MSGEISPEQLAALMQRAQAGEQAAMLQLVAVLSRARRFDEAGKWLRRLADAGHAGAMLQLGGQLVVGLGIEAAPEEGVRLLTAAAGKGAVPALGLLATCAAAGRGRPQDFAAAFGLLEQAARQGFPPAAAQLAALQAAGLGDGARLHASAAAVGVQRNLSETPSIAAFDHFLEPALCAYMISRAQGRLQRATVFDWQTGATRVLEGRTATTAAFAFFESDVIVWLIRARIAAAMKQPLGHLEMTTVIHYDPGQLYAPHYDFIEPHEPNAQEEIARFGQRERTFLIYLSEGYAGGATEFPQLGIAHNGTLGSALGFVSVDADGGLDRRTVHAGRPPERGEKWLLSQWIRNRDQGVQ